MEPPDRRGEFDRDGFTIARGFLDARECDRLLRDLREAQALVRASRLDRTGLSFRHNLFRASPALREFISQPRVVHLLRDIVGPDFWVRWDQSIEKVPGGDEFPWHQDNGYNGLKDGHFQFWVALSEMTPENGGLWLQRGSHRFGNRPHHLVENHLVCPGDPETAVFVPAEPGDVLVFSSFMLHRTSPNVSEKSRLAYVVEYMSLDHFDPFVERPYFVVARGGEPRPGFVNFYRGRLNPANQLKYLVPRTKKRIQRARAFAGGIVHRRPRARPVG
jgi:ectoine hydroxylase-related dioxygenase (phytanoyl-CoA dioxygenase family)